jgi:hypothetical protein
MIFKFGTDPVKFQRFSKKIGGILNPAVDPHGSQSYATPICFNKEDRQDHEKDVRLTCACS